MQARSRVRIRAQLIHRTSRVGTLDQLFGWCTLVCRAFDLRRRRPAVSERDRVAGQRPPHRAPRPGRPPPLLQHAVHLNVTRADTVRAGYSPSVRLFEAACATPIVSDEWPGLDHFFTPGREIPDRAVAGRDDSCAAQHARPRRIGWQSGGARAPGSSPPIRRRIVRARELETHASEVQQFGVRRTAELLADKVERVHWYSLCDLPRAWPATTRHREAEGSSYYGHFYMGLLLRTVRRSSRCPTSPRSRPSSVSGNGFISRITGSTAQFAGCARGV